ncbi:putative F-box/FBD/LRR-repeat protein At4g13965 [Papaver somniferum]|uniref:putative F-box/FBD/LRR-repeat protein At4g13965 n=1 Tax=Papaver somniferum TaxID=3469 RepID=UPI000E6FCF41|nr:putative F-box/FBD/LRR-repeat protein At4g13965 [Papaver somniferum]
MKPRKAPLASDNRDRLSDLPYALILKILSFIDMRSVIRNSILSKRWRYIWKSLPTLNFNSNDIYQNSSRNFHIREDGIIHFIYQVLALREKSIQRLDIVIEHIESNFEDRLYSWILVAVECNVQELSIEICDNQKIDIPDCLFTCSSLTKFELTVNGRHNYGKIFLPDVIDLPRIKCLKLEGLGFKDEELTDEFFLNCPNLESLTIVDTYIEFDICCPTLEVFILEFNDKRSPMTRQSRYGHLISQRKTWCGSNTIRLSAPKLTFLRCKGMISEDNILEDLSSLKTTDIEIKLLEDMDWYYNVVDEECSGLSAETEEFGKLMVNFLNALRNVKFLTLSHRVLEIISNAPDLLQSRPQLFHKPQDMTLGTCLSPDCLPGLTYLMKISPNIKTLSLVLDTERLDEIAEELSCDEFLFTKVPVLDEVHLTYPRFQCPSDRERMEFFDKLSVLPADTPSMTIIF